MKSNDQANFAQLYNRYQDQLNCDLDLETYFTTQKIGDTELSQLELGLLHCPSGKIVAGDPCVELEDIEPFFEHIPSGHYPVKLCVALTKDSGFRYAAVKLSVSDKKPVMYKLAVRSTDNLSLLEDNDRKFECGFGVNTAMACLVDYEGQQEFKKIWAKIVSEDDEAEDPYEELFADELMRSYENHPQYQRNLGEWCNFSLGKSNLNIIMFSSGWGDGVYPCFFGYDVSGEICALYIDFMGLLDP